MRIRTTGLRLLATLLVLGLALGAAGPARAGEEAAAPAGAGQEAGGTFWTLGFENDTPKQLVLEDPVGKLHFRWYFTYRVKNPNKEPLPASLKISMKLSIEKQVNDYADNFDMVAETHIEKKILERPVCNWAEMRVEPLKPGQTREGVAIFSVGREAPDFDKMTISVRGLGELRPLGREGNVRKYRELVLLLRYEQAASRWRTGKELKYLPEEWTLDEVSIADRAAPDAEERDKVQKRMEEILKKAKEEEERRKKLLEGALPPPEKSSAEPGQTPMVAGPPTGQPAPDLVKSLAKLAAAAPTVRATFTEAIGREDRRQETTGTVALRRDGRFAIERNLRPGTEQAIKEQRVFDGEHLWIQTHAKGVGDAVRRWAVAATKKEWFRVDGKPEVDFATVANPARAWRLFADDLLYLGTERLGNETAYVFEVRPDKKYDALLGSPLSGELLGKALGRRARFWVGATTGCQLRMQIYDEGNHVVALFECAQPALDTPIPPETFAYKAPAGVEVTDMNAAFAATDKR